jgi:hypothetical protein
MKKTYLVRETQENGSASLVEISGAAWYALVQKNKVLPKEEQRFFIKDVIWDNGVCDVMQVEVSREEYRAWKTEQQRHWRNQKEGSTVLSLDAPGCDEDKRTLAEVLIGGQGAEDQFLQAHFMESLREELANWRPWGCRLLDQYLQGHRRACTPWLAELCGVSQQTARKYKREFEAFLMNFLRP